MIRLLYLAVVVSLACKLIFGRWPWDYLRSAPSRSQELSRARKLLAVHSDASRSDILAAHKRLIMVAHPDKGGSSSQVHEADAARDLLLSAISDSN